MSLTNETVGQEFRFRPMGDKSILIEFEEVICLEVHKKVRLLSQAIEAAQINGVQEVIPAYRSIVVYYDPFLITFNKLCDQILRIKEQIHHFILPKARLFYIPVCYGGEMGPDLPEVAKYAGLTEEEVIRIHSGTTYIVYMIGFLPGFPYLGGLPREIAVPRLSEPRTKVPAGSVGIAGDQTGIYPIESPGGWRIIGRTPIRLYIPEQTPPVLLAPGDLVKFFSISLDEFQEIREKVAKNTYEVKVEEVNGD